MRKVRNAVTLKKEMGKLSLITSRLFTFAPSSPAHQYRLSFGMELEVRLLIAQVKEFSR